MTSRVTVAGRQAMASFIGDYFSHTFAQPPSLATLLERSLQGVKPHLLKSVNSLRTEYPTKKSPSPGLTFDIERI